MGSVNVYLSVCVNIYVCMCVCVHVWACVCVCVCVWSVYEDIISMSFNDKYIPEICESEHSLGISALIPPLVKTVGSFQRPFVSVQKWQQRAFPSPPADPVAWCYADCPGWWESHFLIGQSVPAASGFHLECFLPESVVWRMESKEKIGERRDRKETKGVGGRWRE